MTRAIPVLLAASIACAAVPARPDDAPDSLDGWALGASTVAIAADVVQSIAAQTQLQPQKFIDGGHIWQEKDPPVVAVCGRHPSPLCYIACGIVSAALNGGAWSLWRAYAPPPLKPYAALGPALVTAGELVNVSLAWAKGMQFDFASAPDHREVVRGPGGGLR